MDLLQFIDSPDIREYNKDTCFTPAEWAVLVSKSLKRTVEEKIEALQYLADHYTSSDFQEESVSCYGCDGKGSLASFRDVVIEMIRVWKEALEMRFETEGVVFKACLYERECNGEDENYVYFSSYEKAWEYLQEEKQVYLDDEDLKDVGTYARIIRIKLDTASGVEGEWYLFDNEMRLVSVILDHERAFAGREPFDIVEDWLCYVPLPFSEGDIVRVDFPQTETYYGVFSHDWKRPETPEGIRMWISLEMYYEKTGDCILGYSYCREEELPDDQQVLKLISDVHKGKLDFYLLFHKYGRKERDQLF